MDVGLSAAPAPQSSPHRSAGGRQPQRRSAGGGKILSPGSLAGGSSELSQQLSRKTKENYMKMMAKAGVALAPDVAMLDSTELSFSKLDVSENKALSKEELRRGFLANGTDVDSETFNVLWQLADQDHDEKISKEEFDQLCELAHAWQVNAALEAELKAARKANRIRMKEENKAKNDAKNKAAAAKKK